MHFIFHLFVCLDVGKIMSFGINVINNLMTIHSHTAYNMSNKSRIEDSVLSWEAVLCSLEYSRERHEVHVDKNFGYTLMRDIAQFLWIEINNFL